MRRCSARRGLDRGTRVRATGETVTAGQLLFTLYSPCSRARSRVSRRAAHRQPRPDRGVARAPAASVSRPGSRAPRRAAVPRRVPFHAPSRRGDRARGPRGRHGIAGHDGADHHRSRQLWVIAEVRSHRPPGSGRHGGRDPPAVAAGRDLRRRVEYVYPSSTRRRARCAPASCSRRPPGPASQHARQRHAGRRGGPPP